MLGGYGMSFDQEEYLRQVRLKMQAADAKIREMSEAIKRAAASGATADDKRRAREITEEAARLREEVGRFLDDGLRALGFSDEQIAALDQDHVADPDSRERRLRLEQMRPGLISPTGSIEDVLPAALEALLSLVPPRWLSEQAQNGCHRLGKAYLDEPLSIVSGMRVASEAAPIHRYAQALLVAKDFAERRVGFDFHAGGLLVPTVARLGALQQALKSVRGDVTGKMRSLHEGSSEHVDSTILELLVAGSCAESGREIEMLSPAGGGEKSPDLRVHNFPVPCVVECKRRRMLFEHERLEEAAVRRLFIAMAGEFTDLGIAGFIEVDFKSEIPAIDPNDFAAVTRRVARFGMRGQNVPFEWGTVAFHELPSRVDVTPTRLYSASFLAEVFRWDIEVPTFDGLLCQVGPPAALLTDHVSRPIGLKWQSSSERSLVKRQRSLRELLADACDQVPAGEMGIVYLTYQEGARDLVADARTDRITQDMVGWGHRGCIVIPAFFVNRLYPRSLGAGDPDLVENAIQFRADFADPSIFDWFPSRIFTAATSTSPDVSHDSEEL